VELAARADLASLDRDIAQQQLEVILVQAASGSSSAPLVTPKDEESARIQERQRYVEMLDADFQLRESKIQLLRQTGELDDWLNSAAAASLTVAKP
jgi:hypothetical protein